MPTLTNFIGLTIITNNMRKKLLKGLGIAVLIFLTIFLVVNFYNPSESIPDVVQHYGAEEAGEDRQWWESTTVYQIYPRSFQDSNDDGIGDLAGIISRLDYIKSLGFETIWFSPFFKSPQLDHGYDVSDYYLPDPVYGDTSLVDSLIQEIHRRDMKVVFDLVLNHTSAVHPWFQESRASQDNPKRDWYVWRDGKGDDPPNNWHSALGMNGWHYDSTSMQWYFSSFLSFQPDLNWRNEEVKQAMFEVTRYWLDKGVDGFRLDIFNFIYEDPSFKNNPISLRVIPTRDFTRMLGQRKKYTMNHPDNFVLARELRSVLDEYDPPRFMVGEVFGDHQTLKKFLGQDQDGLNLIFLFDISDLQWKADFFRDKIRRYEAFYPYPYIPTYVFSNHDRVRSISLLNDDVQKAKTLSLLQLSLRGVPFYYQGEEIGMHTGDIPMAEALDPLAAAFEWVPDYLAGMLFNRDNCRTPMQWSGGVNAGFTSPDVQPWLPVLPSAATINVKQQQNDPQSLLKTNQQLLRLRRKSSPLQWGSLRWLTDHNEGGLLGFERIYQDESVQVIINFLEEKQQLEIDEGSTVLFTTGEAVLNGRQLIIGANTGVILE